MAKEREEMLIKFLEAFRSGGAFKHRNLVATVAIMYEYIANTRRSDAVVQ